MNEIGDVPIHTSDVADQSAHHGLADFLRFTALRYSANAEWVGGAVLGNWLHETQGVNSWVAAAGTALAVTALELPQAAYAANRLPSTGEDREYSLRAEGAALASAVWQGAGASVQVNDSLGLESSPRRRRFQSAAFGIAVGLWVTPLPVFDQGAELGKSAIETAIENPTQSVTLAVLGSTVVFGGLKAIKRFRNR